MNNCLLKSPATDRTIYHCDLMCRFCLGFSVILTHVFVPLLFWFASVCVLLHSLFGFYFFVIFSWFFIRIHPTKSVCFSVSHRIISWFCDWKKFHSKLLKSFQRKSPSTELCTQYLEIIEREKTTKTIRVAAFFIILPYPIWFFVFITFQRVFPLSWCPNKKAKAKQTINVFLSFVHTNKNINIKFQEAAKTIYRTFWNCV